MRGGFVNKRRDFISVCLFIFSAALAVCIFIKLFGFYAASARAERLVNEAANGKVEPNGIEKFLAESKKLAEQLKKKNLFVPTQPQQGHPVNAVMGIFGKEAFINGQWYERGDKVGDAEIVAIEPTQVKIKWNGNEKYFAPISSVISADMRAKSEAAVVPVKRGEAERPSRGRRIERVQSERGGRIRRFGNLSEEERESMRERMRQVRENWADMSEEQRQQFMAEMRQRGRNRPQGNE